MKSKKTKGIILAGGAGTRLYPASIHISKILLPVYDKPMIYYPLSTLMLAGIKDILIISNPDDIDNFKKLLGNGSHVGINIDYKIQYEPRGIAEAILIAEDFADGDNIALILGDNIFYGQGFSEKIKNVMKRDPGATVFGYNVKTPEKFGVVEFDKNMKVVSLEEKPKKPKSNYAVVGLYFYDNKAVGYAKHLKPSGRGELEITDLNKIYLEKKQLNVEILGRGFVWLDTGSFDTLLQASNFVQSMELNAGKKIGCIEEIAIKKGYISKEKILKNMHPKLKNEYLEYVLNLNEEELRNGNM
ncbi:MAG: glucose-1-phosphate thymidylyltransferase RfbA [Endomicrobiaceae bacterium]|jgi:glucose-1-phosphate thymidylyltransferase|nr:glucose-1-phosphate thymidylyltransferase RfbA [Endomicrobiaceae bacterium]MDD4165650.1 glucose-1-phosphate thymidylyltransferase RfbA [Endomicrobiaceae bacterium]